MFVFLGDIWRWILMKTLVLKNAILMAWCRVSRKFREAWSCPAKMDKDLTCRTATNIAWFQGLAWAARISHPRGLFSQDATERMGTMLEPFTFIWCLANKTAVTTCHKLPQVTPPRGTWCCPGTFPRSWPCDLYPQVVISGAHSPNHRLRQNMQFGQKTKSTRSTRAWKTQNSHATSFDPGLFRLQT